MIFRIFVKTDINSINLVGFKGEMHNGEWGSEEWGSEEWGSEEWGVRNEELAKLNRVVLKYEVKDSTERSER